MVFIPVTVVLFLNMNNITRAQEISCDNLQVIVKAVGEDSTFSAIKGGIAKEAKGADVAQYYALTPLWDKTDDVHGEFIEYDNTRHNYVFHGYSYSLNMDSAKQEEKRCIATLKNCLNDGWVTKTDINSVGDTATSLKNLANSVVINSEKHGFD
jgi:hypothetical protein